MNISDFDDVLDDLARQGWALCDDFLPAQLVRELAAQCQQQYAQGLLSRAGVGRGNRQAIQETVRGDSIQWLEPGMAASTDAYLAAMDALREALNRSLFLGLADYECHFALYPTGAFYKKHVDRFRDDDRREISAVFYLNENWGADDGGELRLFLDDLQPLELQPVSGRLVLFRSAQMPHEVLPASRERLSLTGWFRRRGEGVL
jgi:SM-20-related protein